MGRSEGWWWLDTTGNGHWIPVLVSFGLVVVGGTSRAFDDVDPAAVWGDRLYPPGRSMFMDAPPTAPGTDVHTVTVNGIPRTIRRALVDSLVVSLLNGVGGFVMAGRLEADGERGRSWMVSLHPELSGLHRQLIGDSTIAEYLRLVRRKHS